MSEISTKHRNRDGLGNRDTEFIGYVDGSLVPWRVTAPLKIFTRINERIQSD
jgi:hypothetical protein